jgi:hypothetical protein
MDRLKKVMLHLFTPVDEEDEEEKAEEDQAGVIMDKGPDGRRFH